MSINSMSHLAHLKIKRTYPYQNYGPVEQVICQTQGFYGNWGSSRRDQTLNDNKDILGSVILVLKTTICDGNKTPQKCLCDPIRQRKTKQANDSIKLNNRANLSCLFLLCFSFNNCWGIGSNCSSYSQCCIICFTSAMVDPPRHPFTVSSPDTSNRLRSLHEPYVLLCREIRSLIPTAYPSAGQVAQLAEQRWSEAEGRGFEPHPDQSLSSRGSISLARINAQKR